MKKRLLIVLSVLISIIILVSVALYIYINFFYAKSVDLSYGDSFPKIDMYNYSGVKTDISKMTSKYKVIFYVSNHCQACLNDLEAINRIMRLYNSNNFEFIILWESGFPENRIKKAGIEIGKNYSLRNKVKLSTLTPKGFIIDKNNKVVFTADADLELLAIKILDIQGQPDYKNKAYDIIKNDFIKMQGSSFDVNKPSVIVFSVDGCEECGKVLKEVNNNTQIKNKANIIVIEAGHPDDNSIYKDYLNMFSRTFSINFYPSYCITDREGKTIRYCKTIQDIIEQIA